MAVLSQFYKDIYAAVKTRLSETGHVVSESQLHSIVMDVEQILINDQASAIANATADLGLTAAAPHGRF